MQDICNKTVNHGSIQNVSWGRQTSEVGKVCTFVRGTVRVDSQDQTAISPKSAKFGIQLFLIINKILRVLLNSCLYSLEPILVSNFSSTVVYPEKTSLLKMGETEDYPPIFIPESAVV